MMREVVVDGDAAHRAATFQPALDARETRERREPVRDRNAGVARRRERRKRVQLVVAAELRRTRSVPCGAPPSRIAPSIGDRSSPGPVPGTSARPKRSTSDQQPRASTRASAGLAAVHDEPPVRRHRAHEMMELRLDRREVGEDVGVVELEVVEDRGARPVVDELRALVEERRVVLVGLDDEERAVGEPRGHAESSAARRRSGSPARGPRARGSTRASTSVVVLPCVPATASTQRSRARSRTATAAPRRRAGRRRGSPPSADCRATRRCR